MVWCRLAVVMEGSDWGREVVILRVWLVMFHVFLVSAAIVVMAGLKRP